MKNRIHFTAVSLLILLFVYAPVSKLINLADFRGQLHNQPFPHVVAAALLVLLPATELAAAGLLLFAQTRKAGLWLSTCLLAAFTVYIVLVLAGYWARLPCSCGGVLNGLSWTAHLFFNLAFLLVCVAGLLTRLDSRHPAFLHPEAM